MATGGDGSQTHQPPRFLTFRSSTKFILFTVCLAVFTDIFLYGLVVPVLPFALTERAGVPEEQVQQWNAILLACYSGALFIGSPLAGWFADHFLSRRGPLLFGLFALAGSTVLLCVGQTVALLVLGRLLQGFSAAIVWSVGLALLADTVGKEGIGLAMGWVAIALSAGLLVSPMIGGAVYGQAGYYAVFYVAFGLIFLDIVLRLVLVEKKVARKWLPEEKEVSVAERVEGKVASGASTPATQGREAHGRVDAGFSRTISDPGETLATRTPSTTPEESSSLESSSRPGKKRSPYSTLIRSRRLMSALFCIVIMAGTFFLPDTDLPLFVKETFDWDATSAGLMFLCIFIPGLLNPLIGMLVDRHGARWPTLAGFLASIPILVSLRFVEHNTLQDKVLLGALLALLGTALAFTNVPLMAEITLAIEAEDERNPGVWGDKGVYGIGYGLFTTAFALGGTVGSLMAGYLHVLLGWATMTWIFAVWMTAGVVVTVLWVGRPQSVLMTRSAHGGDVEADSADAKET